MDELEKPLQKLNVYKITKKNNHLKEALYTK